MFIKLAGLLGVLLVVGLMFCCLFVFVRFVLCYAGYYWVACIGFCWVFYFNLGCCSCFPLLLWPLGWGLLLPWVCIDCVRLLLFYASLCQLSYYFALLGLVWWVAFGLCFGFVCWLGVMPFVCLLWLVALI